MRYRHQIIMVALIIGLFSGWTTGEKTLWGAYTLAWVVDLGQTRTIAKNPDRYYEDASEWAIGKHPSTGKVHNYFALQYIVNYLIADNIGKWRSGAMAFSIMSHSYCIGNNEALGIKVDLKF